MARQIPHRPAVPPRPSQMPSHREPENYTLFQGFEWDVPADQEHWQRLTKVLPQLKQVGIDNIWLPPACKGGSFRGNGYDIYDPYDLGEFHQKGSRSTKWGPKEDLLRFAHEARRLGIGLYHDAVLNHRCGGDETVKVMAVEVDPKDRTKNITKPRQIEPWLRFTFPGRNNAYSPFKYSWHQFNGTDFDNATHKKAIFKIVNDGKDWADDVDKTENHNADYLLMNNLDYTDKPLREEVKQWGCWIVRELGLSGFRLDAAQHFSQNFANEWMTHVNYYNGRRLFYVGEFWNGDVRLLLDWLSRSPPDYHLYDAPLLYNMAKTSWSDKPDLSKVFEKSLVQIRPQNAVTLVMNHDTQKGQAMDQPIKPQFIPHAYALILLRQGGYPCVFYGDMYGISPPHPSPPTGYGKLQDLILARKMFAYGEQVDYFDQLDCVGWVRMGAGSGPKSSGMAVIMSWVAERPRSNLAAFDDMTNLAEPNRLSGDSNTTFGKMRHGFHMSRRSWHDMSGKSSVGVQQIIAPALTPLPRKRMYVGRQHAGDVWRDLLGWETAQIKIDREGYGVFICEKNKIAVFVSTQAEGWERFPVGFNHDIYWKEPVKHTPKGDWSELVKP